MKTKGIPVWEQYLEFIVLGVAALVFVGLTTMQFIGNPNAVEDPEHGLISPGEVDQVLLEEAERIRPRLESDAPPVDLPEPQPVLNTFRQRLAASVAPSPQLDLPQLALGPTGDYGVVSVDVAFVEPELPAPHSVITEQYFDALPDQTVQELPALSEKMPEKPYDVSWITTAAMFDIADVLEAYRRSGPDGEPASVPLAWYEGRANIVDVVIEREQRVNGGWTNRVQLEPLPGQYTLRPRLNQDDVNAGDRDQILQLLADTGTRLNIVQPEFYSTRNASWYPPRVEDIQDDGEATEDLSDEQREILRMKRRLTALRTELSRVERRLEDLGGELYPGDARGGAGGASGGGKSAPPGGGLGKGDAAGEGSAQQERQERQQIAMTRRRDNLAEDVSRLEGELAERGEQVAPEQQDDATNPFESESIMVWGHDMDVQPGDTYRYRVTVRVLNPYFKRDVHLIDEQKELAEPIYLATEPSDWSSPVTAKPPLEVFLTAANAPRGQQNRQFARHDLGQAFVDVYRFYDGRWWKDRFTVEPGERIGRVKSVRQGSGSDSVDINFGTDWFVLDIVADLDSSGSSAGRRNANVLLQSITHPDVTMWRSPDRDKDSIRREQLEDQVESAELASADGAPAS